MFSEGSFNYQEWSKYKLDIRFYFCPCMSVLDSGFPTPWFPDSRYLISDSLSVELGFRIATISGIQDSLSCIPDLKPRIPESISKNCPKSGMRIHEHGAISFTAEISSFTSLARRVGILLCLSILTSSMFFSFPSRQMPTKSKGKKPHPSKHLGSLYLFLKWRSITALPLIVETFI